MSNSNIATVGEPYRWKKGQSGNPGGRRRSASISRPVRDLLARDSDLFDAYQVLEAAGEDVEKWDVTALSNSELAAQAVVAIALGRDGVTPEAQLKAIAMVWDRVDGKVSDRPLVDEVATRPLMSVEQFRQAISFQPAPEPATAPTPAPTPAPPSTKAATIVIDRSVERQE